MSERVLQRLVGDPDALTRTRSVAPYDDRSIAFLAALSTALLADVEAKGYGDVISFAYWCRRANLLKLRQEFAETRVRLGVGLVFHITPSNVPVNFAFSYAFALLAGNASLVRVPTRDFAQTRIMCRVLTALLADARFAGIADRTAFVRYEQDDAITRRFSEGCNARIIWGGDQAINNIRKFRMPERAVEIVFADRYSFCVMDAASIVRADATTLERLVSGFYNDTFLMDQNACSSPHLVVWLGADAETVATAKARFWDALHRYTAPKYDLQAVSAMDKFVLLCRNAIDLGTEAHVSRHGNFLYRVALDQLPDDIDAFRGNSGYFYEHTTASLDTIAHIVNTKYQTLTYHGVERDVLSAFVVANGLSGIDRIVPIGQALNIGVIWDGYDVVRTLSRIVDVV